MATPETTLADDYYGLLAEFSSSDELLRAAERATAAGYRRLDAYSPMPIEGLAEAIGHERTRLPLVVLVGGLVGAATGYFMQYWMTMDYPMNIGGRPLRSWPAFIPVTFELTILFASLAAVLGMLALNGLPRPNHPLFAVPEFSLATQDKYFLCIETTDPQFDIEGTQEFLIGLNPTRVTLVDS